ncbi:hypothetical protein NXS19_013964 [Fusarium pseudograminearum]|nr:hypothetical protein NXS19_013964 [Fusarium pseudograminearum]
MSSTQGRKRSRLACGTCRELKRKCDGSQPCGACIRFEYDCTYNKQTNTNKRRKQSSKTKKLLFRHLQFMWIKSHGHM